MTGRRRALALICGLILIGNFAVLMMYGDALQSTNLFIVRGTVFYPVAYLNLIAGVVMLWSAFWK